MKNLILQNTSLFFDQYNDYLSGFLGDMDSWVLKLETVYYGFLILAFIGFLTGIALTAVISDKKRSGEECTPSVINGLKLCIGIVMILILIAIIIPKNKILVVMVGFENMF